MTVLQALGMAAKKIDGGSLKDQPLVEAAVRRTIGAAYTNLGSFAEAEAQLAAAVAIATRAGGDAHPDTAGACCCARQPSPRAGTVRRVRDGDPARVGHSSAPRSGSIT